MTHKFKRYQCINWKVELPKMRKMLKEGMTYDEVAQHYEMANAAPIKRLVIGYTPGPRKTMHTSQWVDEVSNLQNKLDAGAKVVQLAKEYGVSRGRLYQVMTQYNIKTDITLKKEKSIFNSPKTYWLNRMLGLKKLSKEDRLLALEFMTTPDTCPALGIPLNYDGTGAEGWSHRDNSPSLDQINAGEGYTLDNIQILSWRANRIKNDSNPEELQMLAAFMARQKENS